MTDDTGTTPPEQGQAGQQPQPGAVMTPPPPPPPITGTATLPPQPQPQRPRRNGLVGGLVLVAIGVILLAEQFFPGFGFDRFWPVIIIVIGLAIIFRRR